MDSIGFHILDPIVAFSYRVECRQSGLTNYLKNCEVQSSN